MSKTTSQKNRKRTQLLGKIVKKFKENLIKPEHAPIILQAIDTLIAGKNLTLEQEKVWTTYALPKKSKRIKHSKPKKQFVPKQKTNKIQKPKKKPTVIVKKRFQHLDSKPIHEQSSLLSWNKPKGSK